MKTNESAEMYLEAILLLKEQKKYMGNYLYCLEVRAEIEGISLKHLDEEMSYKDYIKSTSCSTSTTLLTNVTCNDAPTASF